MVVVEIGLEEVNGKLAVGNDAAVALKVEGLEVFNHAQVWDFIPRLICDIGLLCRGNGCGN